MSSIIGLSVGGCGSRIIDEFYTGIKTESEHNSNYNSNYNNVFFRNCPGTRGAGMTPRSIFIDTDDTSLILIEQNKLYDPSSFIHPTSFLDGTSGNFARSWYDGGKILIDDILERCRYEAENADSLHGFHLMHSTGGGAGSGLLSLIISELRNEYSSSIITTTSILPSMSASDVVCEPYNSALCLSELSELVDWSAIMKNELLQNSQSTSDLKSKSDTDWYREWNFQNYHSSLPSHITKNSQKIYNQEALTPRTTSNLRQTKRSFVIENRMAAAFMVDLTATMREIGSTVNFRKMAVNLVPHPRMVFMSCASAPWRPFQPLLETTYHSKGPEAICYTIRESKSQLSCVDTLRQTQQHYDDKGPSLIAACAIGRGLGCGELELSQLLNEMLPQKRSRSNSSSDIINSDRFLTSSLSNCPTSYGRSGASLPDQPTLSMLICSRTISKELHQRKIRCEAMLMRHAYLHMFTDAGMEQDEIVNALYTLNDAVDTYDAYLLETGDLTIEEPLSDEYQNIIGSSSSSRGRGRGSSMIGSGDAVSGDSRLGLGERDYSYNYSKLPTTPITPVPFVRSPLITSPESNSRRTIQSSYNPNPIQSSYGRSRKERAEGGILRSRSRERPRGMKMDEHHKKEHLPEHKHHREQTYVKKTKASNEFDEVEAERQHEYAYEAEDENSTEDEANQSLLGKQSYILGLRHRNLLHRSSRPQRLATTTSTTTNTTAATDTAPTIYEGNENESTSLLSDETSTTIHSTTVPMIDIPARPSRERFEEREVSTAPAVMEVGDEERELTFLSSEEQKDMTNEIPPKPSRDQYEESLFPYSIPSQDQKEMERDRARREDARRRFRDHLKRIAADKQGEKGGQQRDSRFS